MKIIPLDRELTRILEQSGIFDLADLQEYIDHLGIDAEIFTALNRGYSLRFFSESELTWFYLKL